MSKYNQNLLKRKEKEFNKICKEFNINIHDNLAIVDYFEKFVKVFGFDTEKLKKYIKLKQEYDKCYSKFLISESCLNSFLLNNEIKNFDVKHNYGSLQTI